MERKIVVEEGFCTELERLHYEYTALLQVETSYLDQHSLDVDASSISNPTFETFHERLIKAFSLYEKKKSELIARYGLENDNWNLNFSTREITIK